MTIIVVDLLKKFIAEQKLGGPFDSADMFFGAMQDFLDDERARTTIGDAWFTRLVEERLDNEEEGIPAEEVFASLRERSEQRLRVLTREECRGITSDVQAIAILLAQMDAVADCLGGQDYDAFLSHRHMQMVVERAVQVVATVLRILPFEITSKLDGEGCRRLQDAAGRIGFIGQPVPREELWEIAITILPPLKGALRGLNRPDE